MKSIPGYFLCCLAALMVTSELALNTAAARFVSEPIWQYVPGMCILAVLTALPYATMACSIVLPPRFAPTLWVIAIGMLIVATASLFFRFGEFYIAQEAWLLKLHGTKYMNCAPPPRFAILFLDYVGSGFVAGLGSLVFVLQVIFGSNTPSPPSPLPSPGRNTPR